MGSIERTVDEEDPFEKPLSNEAKHGDSDCDDCSNGVDDGNGESQRDVIRMGGNGF